jgi:hypothetical protein
MRDNANVTSFSPSMDSPLQLLRDLFPFSQPHADSKATADFRTQLLTTSGLSPHELIRKLGSAVLPSISRQADPQLRFTQLEEMRHEAERALPSLEQEIGQAVLPLPKAATSAAINADNLLKGMVQAYAGIARHILEHHRDSGLNQLFHRAIQRALSLLARRQLLAYRAYTAPSAASWQMLHALYRMACDPLAKPLNGETAPIEHEYLGALLFAYLEPAKLPRPQLDLIHACTRQLAAYAVVAEASQEILSSRSAESCFLVCPDTGCPGQPLSRATSDIPESGCLIIDCTQVLAALDRNLARQPGKAVQPDLEISPLLLHSLRVAVGGRNARRFSRSKFKPRADLVGGLDEVIAFLDGNTFSRRALDAGGRHEGNAIKTSEWSLIDESPDGFRIRFINGEKCRIGAGAIIALQPRESSRIHVCLVRRVSVSNTRLELGLQLLSPQVSIVELPSEKAASLRAIFLHSLPAYGKFSGLIVPPGRLATRQRVTFNTAGRTLHRQIGKCIEANEGLEFVALDPLPD